MLTSPYPPEARTRGFPSLRIPCKHVRFSRPWGKKATFEGGAAGLRGTKKATRAPLRPPEAQLQGCETTGSSKLTVPTPPPVSRGWAFDPTPSDNTQFGEPQSCLSGLAHTAAPESGPLTPPPSSRATRHFRRARPPAEKDRGRRGGRARGAGRGKGECLPAAAAATAVAPGAEELAEALRWEPAQSPRPDPGRQRQEHPPL